MTLTDLLSLAELECEVLKENRLVFGGVGVALVVMPQVL